MTSENQETKQPSQSVLTGLSMAGGAGITLAVVALAIGVVIPDVDPGIIGGLLLIGLLAVGASIAAWTAIVQPFRNFDDINVPLDTGHHDDH